MTAATAALGLAAAYTRSSIGERQPSLMGRKPTSSTRDPLWWCANDTARAEACPEVVGVQDGVQGESAHITLRLFQRIGCQPRQNE